LYYDITFVDIDITLRGTMIRTVIGLEPEDKDWLDQKAREEQVSMAALIRRAVHRYREETELNTPSMEQLTQETAGLWKA
jgi:hypothetical protein